MKKVVLLILLCLVSINFISSLELSLSKNIYSPQETLRLEFTGNFISISSDDIFIYKDGVPRHTPVISDFTKQGDIYYYYAVLPNDEGNYSLKIQNSQYTIEGDLKTDDLVMPFIIRKGNNTSSVLSINPGFIITTDNEISIKVKSPFSNQKITSILQATNTSKTISLIEDEEKTLTFSLDGLSQGRTNLVLGSYIVPIFIKKQTAIISNPDIFFSPSEIKGTVVSGSSYFFKIIVENVGNTNITGLKITNNINATIRPSEFPYLSRGERTVINISIPVSSKIKNSLSGYVTISYSGKKVDMPVYLSITENISKINITSTITPSLSCSKIGVRCVYPEKCDGETTSSLEGQCCIGKCLVQEPASSYNWVLGVVLLAIIVGGLVLFYIYQKKYVKPKSSEDIIKERQQRFEERNKLPQRPYIPQKPPVNPSTINPNPNANVPDKSEPSKEVSGNVGRI